MSLSSRGKEGFQEAYEKAFLEGCLENARDSVLKLLKRRLGAVPAAVSTSVQALSSLKVAENRLSAACRAKDMQNFEQILAKSIG